MGNTLVMLTIPDEFIGFTQAYVRDKKTGKLLAVKDDAERRKLNKTRPNDLVFLVPVGYRDMWAMPAEPWRKFGLDWHFDGEQLAAHRERVRRSLKKFLNGNLKKLDEMARSGWFIVQKARCEELSLRERPHDPSEKPISLRKLKQRR